jgi:cold shock CspA family protein
LNADGVMPSPGPHAGRVTSFDAQTGLGTLTEDRDAEHGDTESGGAVFGFHATAIADGSRSIAVGTAVCFTVTPGQQGRFEASVLLPASVA